MSEPATDTTIYPPSDKLEAILKKLQDERGVAEQEWRVSVQYLKSQYYKSSFSHARNSILKMDHGNLGDVEDHKRRVGYPMILSHVRTLIAQATVNEPRWSAKASSAEYDAQRAASFANAFGAYIWREVEGSRKLRKALMWSFIKRCYLQVWWDPEAGIPTTHSFFPQEWIDSIGDLQIQAIQDNFGENVVAGEPIITDELEEMVRDWCDHNGVQIEEKTVSEGQVCLDVVTPFELYLEGGETPKDAVRAIKVKGYDKATVRKRWPSAPKDIKPDSNAEDNVNVGQDVEKHNKKLIRVKELWEPPNHNNPEGRRAVWIGKAIVEDEPYPYDFQKLPFVLLPGIVGPDGDLSLVELLRPLQDELNSAYSDVSTIRALSAGGAGLIAHELSGIPEKVRLRPGQVLLHNTPAGFAEPKMREVPNTPQSMYTHIDTIKAAIAEITGVNDLSNAKLPPNVEAGVALALLLEINNTRNGTLYKDIQTALSDVGTLMLELAKQFYDTERMVQVDGPGGITDVLQFRGEDLNGASSLVVVPESMMPQSKAMQQEQLQKLLTANAISPEDYIEMANIGGVDTLLAQRNADRDGEARLLDRAIRDGQPLPEPQPWEDPEVRLKVLKLKLNAVEFGTFPPEVQQNIIDRYTKMDQALQAKQPPPGQPPKVNVQVRADASSAETAALLEQSGVKLDAQTIEQSRQAQEQDKAQAEIQVAHAKEGGKLMADIGRHDSQLSADMTKNAHAAALDPNMQTPQEATSPEAMPASPDQMGAPETAVEQAPEMGMPETPQEQAGDPNLDPQLLAAAAQATGNGTA